MLKKFCGALVLISLILCGCGKKQEVTNDTLTSIRQKDMLTVGVKVDTPPFGYLDKDGNNIGFDIDLARFVAKKILGDPNKVTFVPVNATNRIMKLALNECGINSLDDKLEGTLAVAFSYNSEIDAAKAMKSCVDAEQIKFKFGLIGTQTIDEAGLKALANLPSKDILVAQLLGLLNGPATGLVSVLNGPIRGLAVALNAIATKN